MNDILNFFYPIILSIGNAHLIILIIIPLSYIFEKLFGLKLLIAFFRWKKSKRNAEIHLDTHTFFYLLILISTFIFSDKGNKFNYSLNSISVFIILIIPLLLIFRKLYSKYQGIDETKIDDELP